MRRRLGVLLLLLALAWGLGREGSVDLAARLQDPSLHHPLGTDELGRDLLGRFLLGGARSVTLGLGMTALHVVLGLGLALAVQRHPWARRLLLGLADTLASIPATLLALLLLALLAPGWTALLLALVVGGWIAYARLALGQLDALEADPALRQVRVLGASPWHRLRHHVLPRLAGVVGSQAAVGVAGVILVEGSLSFLGVGMPPEQASWGTMLGMGRTFLLVSPWPMLWPSLGLLAVLAAAQSWRLQKPC